MNILLLNWQDIKNPLAGGAEVHMHEIFKRIAAKGHKVQLLVSQFEGAPEKEIIDGIHVHRKGSRSIFNYYVPKLCKEFINRGQFDIVIDDINKIPFYTPLYIKKPLLAISHHFFGKSIYHETNAIAGTYVYCAEKMIDKVYKNTPFVVVSKSTLDEFIERGFDRTLFSMVPNAIDHDQFPMDIVDKNSDPTITYFGRMKKYKSVDHLLLAFAKISSEIPNAKLDLLGKGDFLDHLKQLAKDLNIEHKTRFYGFVSEEDKVKLLCNSHCVVNTSMKEGWGITNIEANACGTPALSANVPGLRDSVKQGLSGMLYEYGNIDDLALKLKQIITDEDLRLKLSRGAIIWANEFSWDKSADLMLAKCTEVIGKYNK